MHYVFVQVLYEVGDISPGANAVSRFNTTALQDWMIWFLKSVFEKAKILTAKTTIAVRRIWVLHHTCLRACNLMKPLSTVYVDFCATWVGNEGLQLLLSYLAAPTCNLLLALGWQLCVYIKGMVLCFFDARLHYWSRCFSAWHWIELVKQMFWVTTRAFVSLL
jgi:hypothetical protein